VLICTDKLPTTIATSELENLKVTVQLTDRKEYNREYMRNKRTNETNEDKITDLD